jgi:hypothetical protein
MAWTWFASSPKAKVAKARGRSPRPSLESLEDRTLPSVNTLLFTVDPTQSSATLSGGIRGGSSLQPQGAGSLTTTYHGSFAVSYDDGSSSPNPGVQFLNDGTHSAVADNSGTWQPAVGGGSGSAPANYGGKIDIHILFFTTTALAAVRNMAFVATTPGYSAINPADGTFASNQTLTATAGSADYNAGSLGSGTTSIAGQSASNTSSSLGTFVDNGDGTYQITVPIQFTISRDVSGMTVDFTATGQIVATASVPVISPGGIGPDGRGIPVNYTSLSSMVGLVNVADSTATITNARMLTSMSIVLTNNVDGAGEFLDVDVGSSGLTKSYDPTTATLTISGTASVTAYITMLRAVKYTNFTPVDTADDRIITFSATDTTGATSFPYAYADITFV